jgi:hypothetical protein
MFACKLLHSPARPHLKYKPDRRKKLIKERYHEEVYLFVLEYYFLMSKTYHGQAFKGQIHVIRLLKLNANP